MGATKNYCAGSVPRLGIQSIQLSPDNDSWLNAPMRRMRMPQEQAALLAGAEEKLRNECAKSKRGVSIQTSKILPVQDTAAGWTTSVGPLIPVDACPKPINTVDTLQVFHLRAENIDYLLTLPWSGKKVHVHEFASILPGALPRAIALKWGGTSFWMGPEGINKDPIALAAHNFKIAAQGIGLHRDLLWFLQAVPLGPTEYIHMAQTGPASIGFFKSGYGVDWYLGRRELFMKFRDSLAIQDASRPQLLFGAHSLAAMAGFYPDKMKRA